MSHNMTLQEIWVAVKQINEKPFPKRKVIANSYDEIIANKKNKTIEQVVEQIYFAELMFCKIQNYKGDEKRLRFYENFYKILNSGSLPPKENIRKMSKVAKAYLNMRAKIDEQYKVTIYIFGLPPISQQ